MEEQKTYLWLKFGNNTAIGLVFIFFVLSTVSLAQSDKFGVLVKYNISGGDFKNSKITITRDGKPFKKVNPTKTKTNVSLPFGSKYLFTFFKVGYITKSVIIDTRIPDGRIKEPFAKFSMEVRILPQPEDKVVTYTQPVGIIKYSTEIYDFDFDKDYSLSVSEMQKQAEADAVPKPKEKKPKPVVEKTPPPKKELPPSNPIPVVIKEKEYKPAPPKKKPPVKKVVIPSKPLIKKKTEKIIQEDRRKITIITVTVNNDLEYVYKKEEYSWGGVYFYKNNKRITELTYEKETE